MTEFISDCAGLFNEIFFAAYSAGFFPLLAGFLLFQAALAVLVCLVQTCARL